MSLAAACGWSLLRSLSIATVSLPLCVVLARFVANHTRRWPVILLVVVFLMPELLVGYAYSNTTLSIGESRLSLIHYPVFNEILCAIIVALKMVPVGTAVVLLAPRSPLTAEAIHLRLMSWANTTNVFRRRMEAAKYWLLGPGRELIPAFGLMFLLAFQEFEIASLMQTTAWTVWMFDAHARGQVLTESLRLVLVPTLCEAVVIVPLLVLAIRSRRTDSQPKAVQPLSSGGGWAATTIIGVCLAVVCLIPLMLEAKNVIKGLPVVFKSQSQTIGLAREVGAGAAFGVLAAVLAFFAANSLRRTKSAMSTGVLAAIGLPGLWGSFVLGIVALRLLNTQPLNGLYDTPIPLVLTLALFLFPRVVLLSVLLFAGREPEANQLSNLLSESKDKSQRDHGRYLSWVLSGRKYFLAIAIPAWWGYCNLTLAAMLAPVGMVTAPVNLYNLMHYGRTAALSAIAVLAVVFPLFLTLVAFAITRTASRFVAARQQQ